MAAGIDVCQTCGHEIGKQINSKQPVGTELSQGRWDALSRFEWRPDLSASFATPAIYWQPPGTTASHTKRALMEGR